MYNLEHKAIFTFDNLLLKLSQKFELLWESWTWDNCTPVRELNAKQASMLAFIVYDKVCIVTRIASDVSGVTILININPLIQWAFLNLYTRLWLTHKELW